jgi:hypothetical protein
LWKDTKRSTCDLHHEGRNWIHLEKGLRMKVKRENFLAGKKKKAWKFGRMWCMCTGNTKQIIVVEKSVISNVMDISIGLSRREGLLL